MSKWMKNKEDLFKEFKEEKNSEKENTGGLQRNDIVWKTPEKGTADKPNIYQLRLLMDPIDKFYKTYHYHMYYSNSAGKWIFVLCPKTFDFGAYCPFCAVVSKLYLGTGEDKKTAYNFKRKVKHCCNAYVVKDFRDSDKIEEEKSTGKVLVYEFPGKVESKIKQEMNDSEYGAGMSLFDPGKDGFDFILKVGATKPIQDDGPNKGKSFPDYGDSKFANKPTSIVDSDEVIIKLMSDRHDLTDYIDTMKRDDSVMVDLLKKEMLYELIKEEYEARIGIKTISERSSKKIHKGSNDAVLEECPPKGEPVDNKDAKEYKAEDLEEAALLAELENI